MKDLRVRTPPIAAGLVIGAAVYWAGLCFVHTNVTGLSGAHVAIVDGAIVLAALVLALRGASRWIWILLIALASNFLLLTLLSGSFDAKAVRDPLVLIAFAGLGWRYGARVGVAPVLFIVGAIVVVFAVFEYAAPGAYTDVFNVISFYAARGLVDSQAAAVAESEFFISGARYGERMLLPLLGQHRVSSIFLEPVSMGNFGALAIAFALSLDRARWRTALAAAAIGIFAIVIADARFGSMAALLFMLVRFVPGAWGRIALPFLPLVAIAILVAFGLSDIGRGDDLPTRLAASGRILMSMPLETVFGLASYEIVTFDAGYAYALRSFGLPMCIALWVAFVLLPTPSREAERYKLMIGVYICALLCISGSSLFALKTAALAFFILGAFARAPQLVVSAQTAFRIPRAAHA